jgi:fumarate reductase subunit D
LCSAKRSPGPAALDGFLKWTNQPLVKASEVILVSLLAVHMTGGLRLLLIEFVSWRATWQPMLIAGVGERGRPLRIAVRAQSCVR